MDRLLWGLASAASGRVISPCIADMRLRCAESQTEVAACYVEGDDAQSNEATGREARRAYANWVSLGTGGFFTCPLVLSNYV